MTPNTNEDWLDDEIARGLLIGLYPGRAVEAVETLKESIQAHEATAILQAEINQVTEILMLDVRIPLKEVRKQLIERRRELLALQGKEGK